MSQYKVEITVTEYGNETHSITKSVKTIILDKSTFKAAVKTAAEKL